MNNSMRTGMAEATRLTRAGQLIEATALIQRTLRGRRVPEAPSGATSKPVDVSFVVDAVPLPMERSAPGPDQQTRPAAVATPPLPDVAAPPHERGRASAEPAVSQADPPKDRPSGVSSTLPPRSGSERGPATPGWPARLRATLRLPRRRPGGPVSVPLSEQARRDIWAGGQFIEGSYTNPAGTRAYKLYIPSGYRGQALPLIVMLHGCTQAPDDFAAGTRMNVLAERELFFVVYPEQAAPANPSKCWNWFQATDQHRDRGEPSILAGLTRQILSAYHLNPRRVYVVGLSAGGAMAMILGVNYPDLYAALGVHSGLAYGAAQDLPSALAAMQNGGTTPAPAAGIGTRVVPTIVFHGDQDTTVHPGNGDQVLAQWAAIRSGAAPDALAGTDLRVTENRGRVPEGHTYTRSIYHDPRGQALLERWLVHGAGHGWSGGSPHGSFTDPKGPDASQEMVRFFCQHPADKSA